MKCGYCPLLSLTPTKKKKKKKTEKKLHMCVYIYNICSTLDIFTKIFLGDIVISCCIGKLITLVVTATSQAQLFSRLLQLPSTSVAYLRVRTAAKVTAGGLEKPLQHGSEDT